jgi:RimJ/RimL family protein N-acetyltransferase
MRPEDAADVVRLRSEPSVLAQLFSEAPPTREEHLRWLADVEARGTRREFMLVERASGRSVGTIGLDLESRHRRAEFGVLVGDPAARGTGLATEAGRLLLAHAFGALGLHRVYLHAFADNEPALRLYRRLGFEVEGRLREHALKDGRFRDVIVMATLGPGPAASTERAG